jgi:hypothetical protein
MSSGKQQSLVDIGLQTATEGRKNSRGTVGSDISCAVLVEAGIKGVILRCQL